MPTENTFCTRLNTLVRTQYGVRPAEKKLGKLEFELPRCAVEGGDFLIVRYTESFGKLLTLVLEIEGVYGPDRGGRCLLRRKTIMDVKQLIPWDVKLLQLTLSEWLVRD